MKKLNTKKGFSLIELLVVIAIIGVLSAVGITAYTGYTATAKEQASRTQFSQLVSLVNAEMAKCSLGSGSFAWDTDCTIDGDTDENIADYITDDLGFKSPYDQTNAVDDDQTDAAFVYHLATAADPTNDGDITITCDATADPKTCDIRVNPGNSESVLATVVSAAN